jgi:hypothetical protein
MSRLNEGIYILEDSFVKEQINRLTVTKGGGFQNYEPELGLGPFESKIIHLTRK